MGAPSQNFGPTVALFDMTLDEAFPKVDSGHFPMGAKIIVQLRGAKEKTRGGIIVPDEARVGIMANTQVCKVVAIGPMAFKDQRTGSPWPEGPWFKVGDYVRCPKHGGDRWEVPQPGTNGEVVVFCAYDHLVFGIGVKDPLEVISYI